VEVVLSTCKLSPLIEGLKLVQAEQRSNKIAINCLSILQYYLISLAQSVNLSLLYMYRHISKVRVRYGETDQMGYCYYGNYAQYYEVGRVEALRDLGFSYKSLEESGIMLPVLEYSIKYLKPAYYDDEITIKTMIKEVPGARIRFEYELSNEKGELINVGTVILVFVLKETMRPCKAPRELIEHVQKCIEA